MRMRLTLGFLTGASLLMLSSCGGGGGGGGGCEQVSSGPANLSIRNNLSVGLRAFMPQLSFGADMAAGECNIVGFDARGSVSLRVEAQQCQNTGSNTDCTGRLFGPTRILTVGIANGESKSLTIDASTFAGLLPQPAAAGVAR